MNWKTIYVTVIIFSCAALFFSVTLIHRERLFTESVTETGIAPDNKGNTGAVARAVRPDRPPLQLSRLTGGNLFDPLRGRKRADDGMPKSVNPRANTAFKLHGVFNHGDRKGALIIGASAKGTRLFRENDPLGDGYFVKEIRSDEVIITGGLSEITLQLEKPRTAPSLPQQPKTDRKNIPSYLGRSN